MIVVDTNVMVRLVVGGADGADAARLLDRDGEWAAPGILMSELRNVLIGFTRRGALTPDQAKDMIDDAALVLGDRIAEASSAQVVDAALERMEDRGFSQNLSLGLAAVVAPPAPLATSDPRRTVPAAAHLTAALDTVWRRLCSLIHLSLRVLPSSSSVIGWEPKTWCQSKSRYTIKDTTAKMMISVRTG